MCRLVAIQGVKFKLNSCILYIINKLRLTQKMKIKEKITSQINIVIYLKYSKIYDITVVEHK